jgi:hypothetical protein
MKPRTVNRGNKVRRELSGIPQSLVIEPIPLGTMEASDNDVSAPRHSIKIRSVRS